MKTKEMENNGYTYSLPMLASFTGKGLLGYSFGPLNQKDFDVYYIEVEKGHDTFMISKKITRIYYILVGDGYFTISNKKYNVGPGMLVVVPINVEYCYSGKMTLIAFANPGWFQSNDIHTKWNPGVVGNTDYAMDRETRIAKLAKTSVFGKSPLYTYLRIHRRIWHLLPLSFLAFGPIRSYSNCLHRLVRIQRVPTQAFTTSFLRNKPELELIRRLVERKSKGDTLRVAVLGCSTGPEAYSVAWRIRSARPDLKLSLYAVDISRQAVEVAKAGAYSLTTPQLTFSNISEGLTTVEIDKLFNISGDVMSVKPWIREQINWRVADAGEPSILEIIGTQDLVVANNFLEDMYGSEAERCLRNIARLVDPYGYLFVSGIDLDIRTKVACELGWTPLQELLEEIHDGDSLLRRSWPFDDKGLEPINRRRRDWNVRYAAAFQLVPRSSGHAGKENSLCPDLAQTA